VLNIAAAGNDSGGQVAVGDDADRPAMDIKHDERSDRPLMHPRSRLKCRFARLSKINLSLTDSSNTHGRASLGELTQLQRRPCRVLRSVPV
jgi:hypothetical protein